MHALLSFRREDDIFAAYVEIAQCAVGTTFSIGHRQDAGLVSYASFQILHCHEAHCPGENSLLVVCARMIQDHARGLGQWGSWLTDRISTREIAALDQAWSLYDRAQKMEIATQAAVLRVRRSG